MKIAQINMYYNYSTGKIMLGIAKCIREEGHESKTFSAKTYVFRHKMSFPFIESHKYFGFRIESMIHVFAGIYLGLNGFLSIFGTLQLIKYIKKFKPDIVHLHNLHAFCINFPLFTHYLKKNRIKVVWTLHDCWTFTGHCAVFVMANCEKWKTGCYKCPILHTYPASKIDHSRIMWKLKKKWFSEIENLTIVTPSIWLSDLVRLSYLKDKSVLVINNGIDIDVFQPRISNFRTKHSLQSKFIVLGVAANWGKRKGLDVFIELSERLDYSHYQIVLVGTDENTDKQLPDNILSIHRTQNQTELAEIYSAADVFVNPTREDNYPTVNMESIACGTPVLTFRTGGSPEILNENTGSVVDCDDIDAIEMEIFRICEDKPYTLEACLERAKSFDMNEKYKEYVKLYEDITHSAKRTL